jgi:hypothetical protein
MRFANEHIFVRVDGKSVNFASASSGNKMSTIEGLKLDRRGVVKEFPDLENDENWRHKAIERFKDKIKTFSTEEEVLDYVMNDLKKYGYVPLFRQRAGFRREKL